MRVAVIDIGTNSTRLLVADVDGDELRELTRANRVTRLGEGLDRTRTLTSAAIERTVTCACTYTAHALELGARTIEAVATQAVREADNGPAFAAALRARCSVALRVLSGEEEARYTFLGATRSLRERSLGTANHRVHPARPAAARAWLPTGDDTGLVAVIDVGGGSTEIVVGAPGATPEFAVSLSIGVVRHTERYLKHDPPAPSELDALRAEVRAELTSALAPATNRGFAAPLRSAVAVAGTATSLAAIDQQLERYDPNRVHGWQINTKRTRALFAQLARLPLIERQRVRGLHPERAPTIVAGTVILLEAVEALGLDAFTVSEHDLLHGIAYAIAHKTGATNVELP